MKTHLALLSLIIIVSFYSCLKYEKKDDYKIKNAENELTVTPIFKGSYFLEEDRDCGAFFLFDIKLINNTTSRLEFWTLSAAPTVNVVIDPDQLDFFIPQISRNIPRIIRLETNQEFVVPVALIKNDSVRIDSLRFGFIINKPKYKFGFPKSLDIIKDPKEELIEMRNEKKNVIWSKKMNLFGWNEFLYEIRNIINDSTYSVIPRQRLFH
jgi:hypothetical protein